MSLQFMVICMPRSGSAWAANWLSTDHTLCLHDPMWTRHYSELDLLESDKVLGVSCTGLALFPEFVNKHPARKVILHRPPAEVDASLIAMGVAPLGEAWIGALDRIVGVHAPWTDIFEAKARHLYEFLLQRPFDAERHEMLVKLNVQMDFEKVKPDRVAARRLFAEFRALGLAP